MGAQKWFKFYGQEYLSDPKIERLTPNDRSCWLTLLCMGSLTDGKIRFLTVEGLLNRSGIHLDPYNPTEWETALGVLTKFQNMEMISCEENGDIIILNWEKRQETNMTEAERAKNYRDRKKERHENVTGNVTNVTLDKIRVDKSREESIKSEVSDDTPPTKQKKFSDEDMRLAVLLTELIKRNNPDWNLKGNIETWAEHIEKLHRVDKRTYQQIEYMIRWTQADSFWCQNILSTAKLRDKFNDLIPKLKAEATKAATKNANDRKPKIII